MKIAFFEIEDWEKEIISNSFKKYKLLLFKEPLNNKNVKQIKDIEVLVVFIYSSITKEIIDNLPALKFIVTMSTGYDHIDVRHCNKKRIKIANVPRYGENTVAEHTFALILALSRRLYPSIKRTHEQHSFETSHDLKGFELKGKTLGIIGCGNIGKHVARIGVGFEMNVIVFDRHSEKELAKSIGFGYVNFDTLLKQSDIITLHIPYNKETHHLFNENTINKMKKGAIIINTSRGGIIDTHALVKGLKNKKISAAGLDVLEDECEIKEEKAVLSHIYKKSCNIQTLLEDHILIKMDNVIITPHNAFNSNETLHRILDTTLENITSFIKRKPINIIK
ncbi:hydroxyacid dehydrogenase [Candidatus Pacearchaeota archaeon]|nr:hydroxyacid dehydrogenase [Candidatus Pacearchaeota archaeon]